MKRADDEPNGPPDRARPPGHPHATAGATPPTTSPGYWHIRTAITVLAQIPNGGAGDIPLGRTIR